MVAAASSVTATAAGSLFSTALFWHTAAAVAVVAKIVFPILGVLFVLANIWALGERYWVRSEAPPLHEEVGVSVPNPIPVTEEAVVAFGALPCSEEDRSKIGELVRTLATESVWNLGWKRTSLASLGKEIAHVHPLKFLEAILVKETSKMHMQEIFKTFVKKNGFMTGFSVRLTHSLKDGTMERHLGSFSQLVGGDLALLSTYLSSENWEGFIQCLLEKPK